MTRRHTARGEYNIVRIASPRLGLVAYDGGGMQAAMLCEIVQRLADLQSMLLKEMAAACKLQWRNRTLMQTSGLAACKPRAVGVAAMPMALSRGPLRDVR